jgi:hypothetical protein
MASRARRVDTRRMFAFLAGSFFLASRVSVEQPSREFAPVDVAAGTQDTALQIARISSKPLVCSFRRPVTKSVYGIEIGFSSVTSVRVSLCSDSPPKGFELLASAFRGKIGVRHPRICINRRGSRAKKRLAFGSKSSMCVHVRGSILTGGLPSAPIAA